MIMQAKVQALQVVQKTVEIPQAQIPDEVADTLVAVQHQVPTPIDEAGPDAKKYRNADEENKARHDATKLQIIDEFVHIPGGTHRWMPMVEKNPNEDRGQESFGGLLCYCAKQPHRGKVRGQV